MLRLGDRDGISVADIRVQHDMHIGTAVANVHDVIGADLSSALQLVKNKDFTVASSRASNGFNFTSFFVEKLSSKNMIFGDHTLERGVNHFHRRCRENI